MIDILIRLGIGLGAVVGCLLVVIPIAVYIERGFPQKNTPLWERIVFGYWAKICIWVFILGFLGLLSYACGKLIIG